MTVLGLLVIVSVLLGVCGLVAFYWALVTGQYEDLDGSAYRILDDEDGPG